MDPGLPSSSADGGVPADPQQLHRQEHEPQPQSSREPIIRPSSFVWPSSKQTLSRLGPLPLGCLWTPATPMAEGSPMLYRGAVRCELCGGVVNPYTAVTLRLGEWTCTFCGNTNSNPQEFADPNVESYPELALKAVEYMEPDKQHHTAGFTAASSFGASFVFVVDENIAPTDLENLRTSISYVLAALPRSSVISLITYSQSTVSVYNLMAKEAISSTSFSGTKKFSQKGQKWAADNLVLIAVPLEYCSDNVNAALKVVGNFRKRVRAGASKRPSALGTALHVAQSIAHAQSPDGNSSARRKELDSRVLVFSGSPPQLEIAPVATSAPATRTQQESLRSSAMGLYHTIGSELLVHGVSVDVFNIGHAQLGLYVLSELVKPSAGRIFTYSESSEQLTADLIRVIWEEHYSNCFLVLRCPPFVQLDRIMGPSIQAVSQSKVSSTSYPKDTAVYFHINSLGPNETLAAYLQLVDSDDVAEAAAGAITVQTEVTYTNRKNERVVRICTFQIRTSSDLDTIFAALDGDVTAVLLARLAVVQARILKGTDHLDKTVSAIVHAVDASFKLPLSLQDLPMRMYHLRRGTLMGSLLQHPDDIALAQTAFLSMPLEPSLRQITPTFLMFAASPDDPNVVYSLQLPLVNLAMRSDRVLLLDDQTSLMVWFGRASLAPELEPVRKFALEFATQLAKDRFPRPTIRTLQEGSSMARFLLCRLAPLHKEAQGAQEQQLPELAALPRHDYQRLLASFYRTDELSYGEYCRHLQRLHK